ncbi:MAG: Metallo-beta-lactamase type 2 [Flavobacteriaceae bacterium]|nr:MAG: Metallo-beta-lactamase type 2 [Flavobacteriaceae bacterium]
MKNILTLLFFFTSLLIFSQDKFAKYKATVESVKNDISLNVTQVKNDIFMIEGLGAGMGNIGVLITPNGIIMIDNSFEIIEEMITSTVKKISPKPIKFIINTHYHYDHADGNRTYGEKKIPIIAHHNVRKRQEDIAKPYGGIFPVLENFYVPKHEKDELPTITFKDHLSLHEDNEEISIFYFGNGHTDGDAIIKFNQSNVVHTGDSFVLYGLPFIDISNGGSIKGFIKNLEKIASICDNETIIIPGHGGLSNVEKLNELSEGLKEYYDKTIEGYNKGLNINEISNSIEIKLGETSGFGDPFTVKNNFIRSILLENNIVID